MAGINTDCVGKQIAPVEFKWTWKDVAFYNMGIGAYGIDHTYEFVKDVRINKWSSLHSIGYRHFPEICKGWFDNKC